jgi:hypothetical protein
MDGSIFDRLQKKLDVQKAEEGITAGDISELPAPLRKIMRLMLREVEMTYAAIIEAVEATPGPERMSRQTIDEALEALTTQMWLVRRGEGDKMNYMVNLRRKAGSGLGTNFWNALENKISENKKDAEK